MKKKTSHAFGKKVFLIGTDKNGEKCWLEEGTWDCGWYWGFGYIEVYTNQNNPNASSNIRLHTHFDGRMGEHKANWFDAFKAEFPKSVLSDDEIWELCDLMQSFYTLKATAELLCRGNSNLTSRGLVEEVSASIVNPTEVKRINETAIPAILEAVYKLLTP